MLRPDAVLRNLRRLGRKLRRTTRSATRLARWNPFTDPTWMLQPQPIPVPVRNTRKR